MTGEQRCAPTASSLLHMRLFGRYRTQEVAGSSPASSTRNRLPFARFFAAAPNGSTLPERTVALLDRSENVYWFARTAANRRVLSCATHPFFRVRCATCAGRSCLRGCVHIPSERG